MFEWAWNTEDQNSNYFLIKMEFLGLAPHIHGILHSVPWMDLRKYIRTIYDIKTDRDFKNARKEIEKFNENRKYDEEIWEWLNVKREMTEEELRTK